MGVDFDNPNTNVRRRRALAIAKPSFEGLLTMPEHDQPDHEGIFPASKRRTNKKLRLQSGYCEYKRKALLMKVGFCDVLVWSLNTNEVHKVAAMMNFSSKQNPKSKRYPKGCIYGGRGGNFVALGGGVRNQP